MAMAWQLGLSLLAIFALFGIAWWLRLGGETRIGGVEEAKVLAREADDGFDPAEGVLARDGLSALVRARDGRLAVIKVHGARYAARTIRHDQIRVSADGTLSVDSGDRRYGAVRLQLAEAAPAWLIAPNGVD